MKGLCSTIRVHNYGSKGLKSIERTIWNQIENDQEPIRVFLLQVLLQVNGGQLKNPDISDAIFTLSLSIRILNSQCVEGARDVSVL